MTMPNPERGEIWLIDFSPSIGAEIQKQRPAIVISSSAIGHLPLRIIVPFTSWRPKFDRFSWMIKVTPLPDNGLRNESAADCFQVKSISTKRFVSRIGYLAPHLLDDVVEIIAIITHAI